MGLNKTYWKLNTSVRKFPFHRIAGLPIKLRKWDGSFVLQSFCIELVDFALLHASSLSRRMEMGEAERKGTLHATWSSIDLLYILSPICISLGYNIQPPALTIMSDLYSPDLDDSVIPLSHITTYILENDKNGNNQLLGLDFEDRIRFIWRALNDEDELQEALDIEKLWERRSLRKSWAEAERLRKVGNSKYSGGQWAEALSCYNKALSFLPHDIKDQCCHKQVSRPPMSSSD